MSRGNGDWEKVVIHPCRVVDGNGEYIVKDAPLFQTTPWSQNKCADTQEQVDAVVCSWGLRWYLFPQILGGQPGA